MTGDEIAALRSEPAGDIVAQLGDLATDDLATLLEQERGDADGRPELVEALEAMLAAREEVKVPAKGKKAKAKAPAAPDADAADKVARGEEGPAWQKADYSGPLTMDQAIWRNRALRRK